MRSGLDHLREIDTPRPEDVCAALGWRVEPLAGFIVYGVLWNVWLTVMGFTAGMFVGIALGRALGAAQDVLALALGAVGASVSVFFFVRWARRRRAGAKRLVRDGKIVIGKAADKADRDTAQIASRLAFVSTRNAYSTLPWFRVNFLDGIHTYYVWLPLAKEPADGTKVSVLFTPDYKYALGFDPDGRALPCKLYRT